MAQRDPAPALDDRLVNLVIDYLQTRDVSIFPFTDQFTDEQQRAFVRDLRMGLSDLTESGSKRGTAASGFLVSDRLLHEVVEEWAAAGGGWPTGSDPRNPYSSLSAVADAD